MLARKFVLNNKIRGVPKLTDFKLVEETLPELQDGGKLYLLISSYFIHLFTYYIILI